MTTGLGLSLRKPGSPTSELEQVRSLASKLVVDVHDAVRDLPGSTKARQTIVQTGINYLDELVRSAGRDPHAQTSSPAPTGGLATFRAMSTPRTLGTSRARSRSIEKALPLLDDAIRQAPDDIDAVPNSSWCCSRDRDAAGGDREPP